MWLRISSFRAFINVREGAAEAGMFFGTVWTRMENGSRIWEEHGGESMSRGPPNILCICITGGILKVPISNPILKLLNQDLGAWSLKTPAGWCHRANLRPVWLMFKNNQKRIESEAHLWRESRPEQQVAAKNQWAKYWTVHSFHLLLSFYALFFCAVCCIV